MNDLTPEQIAEYRDLYEHCKMLGINLVPFDDFVRKTNDLINRVNAREENNE